MTTTVILGDIHSRRKSLTALLKRIGVMSESGDRVDGYRVIQLGDAVSLGYGMKEQEFYQWIQPWVDEWLVGNHEAVALWNHDDRFCFLGSDSRCHDTAKAVLDRGSEYKMAATVGDWLITHAGVVPAYQKSHCWSNVDTAAMELNGLWSQHMTHGVYACSIRSSAFCPICSIHDGCLWGRWDPLRGGYRDMHLDQIVGHTPVGPVKHGDNLWNIDTTRIKNSALSRLQPEWHGGTAALVTSDNGDTLELFYEQ